jgi:hypothetical protein
MTFPGLKSKKDIDDVIAYITGGLLNKPGARRSDGRICVTSPAKGG